MGPTSAKDRAIHLVARLKHSAVMRSLLFPAMNLQYARRDATYRASLDSRRIKELRDSRLGERCFILGNGPSLTVGDLDALRDEVTFGSNRIYGLFNRTSWRPTYYIATDREFIAQEAQNIADLPLGTKFLNITPYSSQYSGRDDVILINKRPSYFSVHKYTLDNISYSYKPYEFIAEGYTVTYTALQLALFMGFKTIYLLGMDHVYNVYVSRDGVVRTRDGVANHCYEDPRNAVINPQYVEGTEFAYQVANEVALRCGARIYNATRGGVLEVFDRVNLDGVLLQVKSEGDGRR